MSEQTTAPDQDCIDDVLFCGLTGSSELLKTLLKMLYKEGREFSHTQESERWQKWLRELELYKAASILWSISNMDSYVISGRNPEMDIDDMLGF